MPFTEQSPLCQLSQHRHYKTLVKHFWSHMHFSLTPCHKWVICWRNLLDFRPLNGSSNGSMAMVWKFQIALPVRCVPLLTSALPIGLLFCFAVWQVWLQSLLTFIHWGMLQRNPETTIRSSCKPTWIIMRTKPQLWLSWNHVAKPGKSVLNEGNNALFTSNPFPDSNPPFSIACRVAMLCVCKQLDP